MIFLPIRGRKQSLRRFIMHYKITNATLPVTLIIDEDDHTYDNLSDIPEDWGVFRNPCVRNLSMAVNNAFKSFPKEPFYGVLADDVVPSNELWDTRLAEAAGNHNIAWAQNGIQTEYPSHPFFGGDLIRALGWIYPKNVNRYYAYNVWKDLADNLEVSKFQSNIWLDHRHWGNMKAQYDPTYACQPSPSEGREQYAEYRSDNGEFWNDIMSVKTELWYHDGN